MNKQATDGLPGQVEAGEGGLSAQTWLREDRTVYALQEGGYRRGEQQHINRWSFYVQGWTGATVAELTQIATLAQAAPDLLAALKNTLAIARIKWGNLDPQANEVMRRADAAIAKATSLKGGE